MTDFRQIARGEALPVRELNRKASAHRSGCKLEEPFRPARAKSLQYPTKGGALLPRGLRLYGDDEMARRGNAREEIRESESLSHVYHPPGKPALKSMERRCS